MVRLSVNLNKIALVRNSRGSNYPDLLHVARECERFGAQGITVHPRPDERHVKFSDLQPLKALVTTEFNIEGYPDEHFMDAVLRVRPHQCTLVPDEPGQLTSDHGWDTIKHRDLLQERIGLLKLAGIRVSLFIDPVDALIEGAANVGADRIEYYTGPFAKDFSADKAAAIAEIRRTAPLATTLGLGINAGHDLNLHNLRFFKNEVAGLEEVSIGHAIFCDALYYGLENTIRMYLHELRD